MHYVCTKDIQFYLPSLSIQFLPNNLLLSVFADWRPSPHLYFVVMTGHFLLAFSVILTGFFKSILLDLPSFYVIFMSNTDNVLKHPIWLVICF